ncbi:MAG: DUF6362 family protein [Pseudomonadota bacterium]
MPHSALSAVLATEDRPEPVGGEWTAADVRTRLQAAAETLRRLPRVGGRPAGMHSSWPDFVRGVWDHGSDHSPRRPSLQASPRAIDQMDAALQWLRLVDDRAKRVVCFARAAGVGATRLAEEFGCDRKTIARWRAAAETDIAKKLNKQSKTV